MIQPLMLSGSHEAKTGSERIKSDHSTWMQETEGPVFNLRVQMQHKLSSIPKMQRTNLNVASVTSTSRQLGVFLCHFC